MSKIYEIVENRGKDEPQRVLYNPIRASLHYVGSPDDKVWLSEVQSDWINVKDSYPPIGEIFLKAEKCKRGEWYAVTYKIYHKVEFAEDTYWKPWSPPVTIDDEKRAFKEYLNKHCPSDEFDGWEFLEDEAFNIFKAGIAYQKEKKE